MDVIEQELKRYTERLCAQFKVDYGKVVGGGGSGRERKGYTKEVFWARIILLRRFRGEIQQKDIAKFLNLSEDSASKAHKRFFQHYQTNYKFREAILYLDSIGFEGLIEKGITPQTLTKELDNHIDELKKQQDRLSRLIDNTYKLKLKVVESANIEND